MKKKVDFRQQNRRTHRKDDGEHFTDRRSKRTKMEEMTGRRKNSNNSRSKLLRYADIIDESDID